MSLPQDIGSDGRGPLDAPEQPRPSTTLQIAEATADLAAARSALVHCDGGCEPNPGVGGWGILIEASSLTIELCGGDLNTTNNRMEMTAAIVALSVLPLTCSTTIFSDSQYLVKGMTLWMDGWQRKNFRKGGNPIPNADLWMKLNLLSKGRWVQWRWVRGHNGHAGNERADALATEGRLAVMRAGHLAPSERRTATTDSVR